MKCHNERPEPIPRRNSNFRLGICITFWDFIIFRICPEHAATVDAGLIVYLDAKFPDPFYTDFFVVLLTAIDGKQEVGDQA